MNEDGYVTYPYKIFERIEPYIRQMKWRISNVECGGPDNYEFPFEHTEESMILPIMVDRFSSRICNPKLLPVKMNSIVVS